MNHVVKQPLSYGYFIKHFNYSLYTNNYYLNYINFNNYFIFVTSFDLKKNIHNFLIMAHLNINSFN